VLGKAHGIIVRKLCQAHAIQQNINDGVTCADGSTIVPVCSEGKMPAVSYLALEQVHLLIFIVAMVHVLCGFVLYFISAMRIRAQWAHLERLDDPASNKVRAALSDYFAGLFAVGSGEAGGDGCGDSQPPETTNDSFAVDLEAFPEPLELTVSGRQESV